MAPVRGISTSSLDHISLGPWGGEGGTQWSHKFKGGLKQIIIVHGTEIDSLVFKSGDDQTPEYSEKYGTRVGQRTDKVNIDYPNEYLRTISGTCDTGVKSLCFSTNLTVYGPFGSPRLGSSFSLPMEGGVIVGFHGRSGWYLDAIGVYVRPKGFLGVPGEPHSDSQKALALTKDVTAGRGAGPWGGPGGRAWDDGVFGHIARVLVFSANDVLQALNVWYVTEDGEAVSSQIGDAENAKSQEIMLEHLEFLVGISGYYGPIEGNAGLEAIRSITFYSNKRKFGPFGKEIGTYFASATGGRLVGFHGRSGCYVDAIGVHTNYNPFLSDNTEK